MHLFKIMALDIRLRPLRPSDGDALRQLFVESPDSGRFSVAAKYQIDPYLAVTSLNSQGTGVVAEVEKANGNQIVGLGLVQTGNCYLDGSLHPYGLLNSLIVHPDYRRQGVAVGLAQWRIDYVQHTLGKEAVIMAFIQKGNGGSLAVAQKWGGQMNGLYCNSLVNMRQKAPKRTAGWLVREATADEYDQIAQNLNTFYRNYNLYTPQTAQSLTNWLNETPFTRPFRHYYLLVDSQNKLLAGCAVAKQYQIVTMNVKRMPAPVHLLNQVVKMVPPDGVLRQMSVSKIWYAPEQLPAARYLWESVRWQLRANGSHLLCSYDPRGPVPAIIKPPFWLPKGTSNIVVQNMKLSDRLIGQI